MWSGMFHVKHVLADCISFASPCKGKAHSFRRSIPIPSVPLGHLPLTRGVGLPKVHPLRWAALWYRLRAGRRMGAAAEHPLEPFREGGKAGAMSLIEAGGHLTVS